MFKTNGFAAEPRALANRL